MKFDCGASREEKKSKANQKYQEAQKDHKWFAWFPVKVSQRDCRWLEYVNRRWHTEAAHRRFDSYYWEDQFGSWVYSPLEKK